MRQVGAFEAMRNHIALWGGNLPGTGAKTRRKRRKRPKKGIKPKSILRWKNKLSQ